MSDFGSWLGLDLPPEGTYLPGFLRGVGLPYGCDALQAGAGGRECASNVVLGMGRGDKKSFELRGWQENAAIQHLVEESRKTRGVRFFRIGIVSDRLVREEKCEQRARGIDMSAYA